MNETQWSEYTEQDGTNYQELRFQLDTDDVLFTEGTHFSEDENNLFHIRAKDRDYNGTKVLYIEELQSDWAQTGRDAGFLTEKTKNDYKEILNKLNTYREELEKLRVVKKESVRDNEFYSEVGIRGNSIKDFRDEESEYFTGVAYNKMKRLSDKANEGGNNKRESYRYKELCFWFVK